ncbi:hypothetical protein [Chengkuizengella axinellae]|uniref:Uncharacterized protein n=1 Tax=Chengkuizengella axinellae TaxID=3064388 RepID=A0ABT9IXW5_9BACL|nr:hypothetical protein [Chengkuizengella sp. 2205SS18-9]MDP5274208.1 hypothetical protein [Chengkuizengella sp. 2205SS18-9]
MRKNLSLFYKDMIYLPITYYLYSILAYYDGERMEYFESESPGYIAESIQGQDNKEKWSDLWYIFIPKQFNKTLAQFNEMDFEKYANLKKDSSLDKFGQWYLTNITPI